MGVEGLRCFLRVFLLDLGLITATAASLSGAAARCGFTAAVGMSPEGALQRIRIQRHVRFGQIAALPRRHRRAARYAGTRGEK